MTTLSSLKLTTAQKPTQMSAVQQRRNKLAKRLWEQMELAKAQQTGTQYTATKFRTITDNETGLRKQVETNKRVKAWWFVGENGKLSLSVRYGTKVLELGKREARWLRVGREKNSGGVCTAILNPAVLAGELGLGLLKNAANKLLVVAVLGADGGKGRGVDLKSTNFLTGGRNGVDRGLGGLEGGRHSKSTHFGQPLLNL
jgi:hypothetical protein